MHCAGTGLLRFTGNKCPDCRGTGSREERLEPPGLIEPHPALASADPNAWLEEAPTGDLEGDEAPTRSSVNSPGLSQTGTDEASHWTNAEIAQKVIWGPHFLKVHEALRDRLLDQFDKLLHFGPKEDIPRKGPCFRCLSDTKVRMRVIGSYGEVRNSIIEGPGLVDFLVRFGGDFLNPAAASWLLKTYGGIQAPGSVFSPSDLRNASMTIWLYFCGHCHTGHLPDTWYGEAPSFEKYLGGREGPVRPWLFWSSGKPLVPPDSEVPYWELPRRIDMYDAVPVADKLFRWLQDPSTAQYVGKVRGLPGYET